MPTKIESIHRITDSAFNYWKQLWVDRKSEDVKILKWMDKVDHQKYYPQLVNLTCAACEHFNRFKGDAAEKFGLCKKALCDEGVDFVTHFGDTCDKWAKKKR